MTIRQISETAGCHIDTVRRIGKAMFPAVKAEGRGLPIEYSKEQSISIMNKLPKKNYIADPMQIHKAESMQLHTLPENGSVTEILIRLIENQQKMMEVVLSRIDRIENNTTVALPAPIKTDRDTLRQAVSRYAREFCDNDYRDAWSRLYEELYYREHVSIRRRSDTTGRSKLDCIEDAGLLDSAYLITLELMRSE